MRRTLALSLALCALPMSVAAAQNLPAEPPVRTTLQNRPSEPPAGTLLASATTEALRLASIRVASRDAVRRAQPQDRSWIARHPVWFGTLVGAGAGAVSAVTMENELFCSGGDEDCFFHGGSRALVGAGFGAGIGALTGLIVGLASK